LVLTNEKLVVNIRRWLRDVSELMEVKIEFPVLADQEGEIFSQVFF